MFIAFDTTNNSQLLLGAKPHIPLLKELRFITHESSINITHLMGRGATGFSDYEKVLC